MNKRNLFTELKEGFDALGNERKGKLTLKTSNIEIKSKPSITGKEIVKIRNDLRMSQAVFAAVLRVEKRTLERWERGSGTQGSTATLIKLVEKYPDTLDKVSSL